MLSRVADSLYWMARNCERTENNAHILGVQLIRMLEVSEQDRITHGDWETILEICSSKMEYERMYGEITVQNLIHYLAFSKENPNSLSNTLLHVRENAKTTRNIIPNDLWEVWNDFYLASLTNVNKKDCSLKEIHSFLKQIKITSMTSTGIIDSAMSRDLPYQFMKIGKWLERAEKTAIILKVSVERSKPFQESGLTEYYWRSALQLVNGYEDYSKKFRPLMNPKLILQFLLSDKSFPRSIRYCMSHVRKAIMELESERVSHYSWKMYAALDKLRTDFDETRIEEMTFEEIESFVNLTLGRCSEFSQIFSETYYLIEADSVQ
ncbi:alpha-E domain-containing protein [Mesobacillus foraminis]|uniref:Putative alpha-E superfamily protein n=1 Tax=Mesobacillus foraminis TaxID=279826 RepID=A0A4R2BN73_9BACI|nr:alpha-E domain-containing protein [Mesobacillus foraminis]TCN27454.1 putative alpha-E superfamily protein [Mesobacillus foraminis]